MMFDNSFFSNENLSKEEELIPWRHVLLAKQAVYLSEQRAKAQKESLLRIIATPKYPFFSVPPVQR
jgi:hypothetical protein